MKSKGSILETRSQHGRQRVNIGDMESKWKTVGQHWSQRVNMKGQGLILETRVNKEDRGQHSRQGVTMVDKGSTVEIRGQKRWQAVNIRGKGQTLETRGQHWGKNVNIDDSGSKLRTKRSAEENISNRTSKPRGITLLSIEVSSSPCGVVMWPLSPLFASLPFS